MIIYNKESNLSTNTSSKSSSTSESCMKDFDWCRYYFKTKSGNYFSAESNVVSRDGMKKELESILGEALE